MEPKPSVAIIDSSLPMLLKLSDLYKKLGFSCHSFLYPDSLEDFWSKIQEFDYILIDHSLGGTNGANVARNVLARTDVPGKVRIISDEVHPGYSRGFQFYFEKSDLMRDPEKVIRVQDDIVRQAVETSVLMQMNMAG